MKFGDYIRQKREANSWTQPEAAARAQIEQSYLSKLETGKSYPSEEVFEKLKQAYSINLDDLGSKVAAEEMERLREIAQVRQVVLHRQKERMRLRRSWLVAGLVSLIIGTGLTFYEALQEDKLQTYYLYQSDGLLTPEEGPTFFRMAGLPGHAKLTPDIVKRMVPKTKRLPQRTGETIVEEEGEYLRFYHLDGAIEVAIPQRDLVMMALGVALLVGGFGCFFVGYRWD